MTPETITVERAAALKDDLERHIAATILAFETETGLVVRDLSFKRVYTLGQTHSSIQSVHAEVSL